VVYCVYLIVIECLFGKVYQIAEKIWGLKFPLNRS